MASIDVEVDDTLRDRLEDLAKQDRRAVGEYVALILERHCFGLLGRDYSPPSASEIAEYLTARARPKREALTARQRNRIFEASDGKCAYCGGTILYNEPWDVDHIVPVAKGGTNEPANLTLSCVTCNRKKHVKAVA